MPFQKMQDYCNFYCLENIPVKEWLGDFSKWNHKKNIIILCFPVQGQIFLDVKSSRECVDFPVFVFFDSIS